MWRNQELTERGFSNPLIFGLWGTGMSPLLYLNILFILCIHVSFR